MRFLLDQSTDARLGNYLRSLGHDATRIGADHPAGLSDHAVLAIAERERRILITDDRDFGDLVVRLRQRHAGIIYLRLGPYASLAAKVARVEYVLLHHADQLGQLLIVTPQRVRARDA